MAIQLEGAIQRYVGVAADVKPTADVKVGSTYYETDTGNMCIYSVVGWTEKTQDVVVNSSALPAGAASETTLAAIKSSDGIKKITDALPAGTNLLGKVGIDQATANANEVVVKSITAGDNNIGNVDIVTLPAGNLGQRAMTASLSTVPASDITDATYIGDVKFGESLPAGTNAIGGVTLTGSTTGKASSATFTRPNDATPYTAGDVVSTLAGAVGEFATVGAANDLIAILGARFTCAVNAVPAGCTGFYLHLYNAAPTAIADNAAYNLPAADLAKYLGYVRIGQPEDLGDNIVAINDNINHTVKLASTSLYWILQTIGAYTPTANAVKAVTINVAGV